MPDPGGGADSDAKAPSQGRLLRFVDPQFELAYRQAEYGRNRTLVAIGFSIVALIVVVFFIWLDRLLAPAEMLASLRASRLAIGLPTMALVVMGAFLIKDARIWTPWCAILTLLYALHVSALLIVNGNVALQFLSYSIWQGMIATFFLAGLPLRWSITTSAACVTSFALAALWAQVSIDDFLNYFAVDVVVVFALSSFATYRYERASRAQFVAQRMSRLSYERQLLIEADRRYWLEVIAAFLRHELKNAMTGVSTSIELVGRMGQPNSASKYLERAQRSVSYMRRLLSQVAGATSLESALKKETLEMLDLSMLIADRMEDYRVAKEATSFLATIEPRIWIRGNADAILQLLDKLVDNAIEHCDQQTPITLELSRNASGCQIVVSDRGDPIPADADQIFQPFVTMKKAGVGAGDNLGLGLFVVRTIATHHGGNVYAQNLPDGSGARFVVEFPLGEVPGQPGNHR